MDDRPHFVCAQNHCHLPENQRASERRTRAVIALTLVTMAAEVSAGIVFGSMALLADGWHMASHASALTVGKFWGWAFLDIEVNPASAAAG